MYLFSVKEAFFIVSISKLYVYFVVETLITLKKMIIFNLNRQEHSLVTHLLSYMHLKQDKVKLITFILTRHSQQRCLLKGTTGINVRRCHIVMAHIRTFTTTNVKFRFSYEWFMKGKWKCDNNTRYQQQWKTYVNTTEHVNGGRY